MAEQEITADLEAMLDVPAPSRSGTGRAVALARLLHQECTHLLQLYRERECFLADHTPDGGRILCLSTEGGEEGDAGVEKRVGPLHAALRQCLALLRRLILREEEELGELEGEYEDMRRTVRGRLEHLLLSTRSLLPPTPPGGEEEVSPNEPCTEEVDGDVGSFALKMWTYRVLLELLHWADHASLTLHHLHTQQSPDDTEDV